MAKKNVYEVFEEFQNYTGNRPAQVALLRHYNSQAPVKDVLLGAFHPYLKFTIKEIPKYKTPDVPPGMSYQNMSTAIDKTYLFIEGHPKCPPTLSYDRKIQLLQQLLESLEAKESELYANMLMKDLKVPGLTVDLAVEAFPDLLQ
jgi:hypothetical protein